MSIINYFKETKAEMKHVTWPSTQQAIVYTILVIGLTVFVAALLGFFDHYFAKFIQSIII